MINRRRKRNKEDLHINVAPFVDVMLVLMMIFMLTSQISTTVGIKVDLPKTTTSDVMDESNDSPVVITVDKDSNLYIEEAMVSMTELLAKLPKILDNSKTKVVYIKGDMNLNYGALVDIMGIISESGCCKVALIAEHKEHKNQQRKKK